MVELLLDAQKINVDQTDLNGDTAVHYAASKGNDEMCRVLISNGSSPFIRNNK